MSMQDWIVVIAAVALTAALGWFFFGPKKSSRARLSDGVQEVTVVVKGGYSPDFIEVQQGVPVRLDEHDPGAPPRGAS